MGSEQKKTFYKRGIFAVGVIALVFIVLIGWLFNIQIIKGDELASKQESYILTNINITAERGDIYDRNMNILAKDATCSMVYAFPGEVSDPEGVAKYISELLNINYNDVLKKLTNTSLSYVVIQRGIENTAASKIMEQGFAGIGTSEDKKRNYSDTEFASYILGFTGTDHSGLYGIESTMNSILSGEDGIRSVLVDANGRVIESSSNIKKEAVQGGSIVLTIDSVIQYYAESAVYEAYLKNEPRRAMAIVMNPQTGEILAMAAYPAYSLDNPWEVTEDYNKSYYYGDTTSSLSAKQLTMWSNPFTSFIYEPGSTFKGITVSAALEENVVTLDSTFNCSGTTTVSGVTLKCHVYPRSHGKETLTQAVVNSCNPAFVDIGSRMGVDTFYRYIYNYGYGQKTGIELDGEESGIVSANQNVNKVDFATLSYGQGIGVTPIQMIQALNAVVNGGYLISPSLIEGIIDPETGEIAEEYAPNIIRQVISEETSAMVREIFGAVGQNISSISGYRSEKIGGKTGTAQKYKNGVYQVGKYVVSFYGIIPYDNPVLSVIVLVDEPSGHSTMGSTVAAPIGAKILSNSYKYLISKQYIDLDNLKSEEIIIPDVRGEDINTAIALLSSKGILYNTIGSTEGIIVSQSLINCEYMQGMIVDLVCSSDSETTVKMPDLTGLTVQKAKELLESQGLMMDGIGSGVAVQQSVAPQEIIEKGSIVTVIFEHVE